jgi:hypothetical protein
MKFKGIPGQEEGMYRDTAAKPFGVSLLIVFYAVQASL